ncbi:MAG: ABC transporter ATP-binding protein, partial [Pseudobdellovibrionaceae bacterium]
NMIRIENFHKSFADKHVHKGVSFSIEQGQCLGLIGGSGTGKSVLLRSIIGLEKPDQGQIWIDDDEISKFSEDQLLPIRKKVAYAFQGGALFDSMTVFENLAYPLKEHFQFSKEEIKHRVLQQLKDFGLEGNDAVFPSKLSGGMQKRVGLARAMMMNPKAILYDEPTAGLDPFNTKKIQDLILKLKSTGTTAILVTHDMPTAFAVCDRMAILSQGRIAAQGTVDEIEKSSGGLIQKFIQGEGL